MTGAGRFFAASYAEARAKFLAACETAGLHVQSHPLAGKAGEVLEMDVAGAGAPLVGPQVTSIYDGSSASALLTGMLFEAAYEPARCARRPSPRAWRSNTVRSRSMR